MLITRSQRLAALFAAGLSVAASGCSTGLFSKDFFSSMDLKPAVLDGFGTEQRVITQFTDARTEDNEAAFRKIVSTRFEQKALRSSDAYKDLEILNLPKAALEVVESTEAEDKSLAVVAKEEGGTKYQFRLLRDPEKHRWVIDDVILRQQKKGTRASKSTVEVMDLLLTVREFLDVWQKGSRESVLHAVSTDLRTPLEQLPDPWLQQLIQRIAAEYETGMARRPNVQMNESDAVVNMPSKNGFLLMKVVQDDGWKVSDIEVRQRKTDEHPGSLLRQARSLNTVTQFLAAYQSASLDELRELSEPNFFAHALSIGDLSLEPLPQPDVAPEDFELRSFAGQLTVIIPTEDNVIRMALKSADASAASERERRSSETQPVETRFVVADVTINNRRTQRQRNLTSAFTAPARAQLFLSALQSRDLPMIRQISSLTLTEEAWSRLTPELVQAINLDHVPSGTMTLQDSVMRGDVTELEFQSSDGRLCSVVMKDENGTLKVDDIHFPDAQARVCSLRTQLMLSMPVLELALGWSRADLTIVQKNCSLDFNRLVWSNVQQLPAGFDRLPVLLQMPVVSAEAGEQQAELQLADAGHAPVTIRLVKENTAWVVDEIAMSQADGTAFEVRKSLRRDIAQRFLDDPTGGITQAMYSASGTTMTDGVTPAVATSDAPRRGNFTLPSTAKPAARRKPLNPGLDLTPETEAVTSKSDNSGTLHFGPDAAARAARANSPVDVSTRVDPVAEPSSDDGTIYFRGDSRSSSDAISDESANARNLSDHPIDIPVLTEP